MAFIFKKRKLENMNHFTYCSKLWMFEESQIFPYLIAGACNSPRQYAE